MEGHQRVKQKDPGSILLPVFYILVLEKKKSKSGNEAKNLKLLRLSRESVSFSV